MRPPTCTCGECAKCKHAAYMRAWYARPENRERVLAAQRLKRTTSTALSDYDRRRWHSDPEYRMRKTARIMVKQAIKRGKMTRQPCEVCGAEFAEAHHDDYARALDVRWLCPKHHVEHHRFVYMQDGEAAC